MVNDAFTDQLSEEDREIYENGIKGQSDYSYEPVSVLATQVVSGVNYAFLVYGNDTETVHAGGPSAYAVAIIWKDLNGTSTLMNLTQIDPVNIHTTEPVTGDLTGGWTVQGSGKAGMLPGEEIQTSFEDVTADLKVRLNPVVLIASQLVSGSNYIALSKGDDNNLYFTQWYRDLNGNASLTSNGAWDWEFYNP